MEEEWYDYEIRDLHRKLDDTKYEVSRAMYKLAQIQLSAEGLSAKELRHQIDDVLIRFEKLLEN